MKTITSTRHGVAGPGRAPRIVAALALAALALCAAAAQDGFGFGADDAAAAGGSADGAGVGGRIEFGAMSYLDYLALPEDPLELPLAGLATGRLEFGARGGSVEGNLTLELSERVLRESPESIIDTASVRAFAGPLTLEGGLLKLSWGKADSQGPLDVLNPVDLTDLTMSDTMDRKIARPMLRASLALGKFTAFELVGVLGFEGNRIAFEGPWMPAEIGTLKTRFHDSFYWGADPEANEGKGEGLYASYYASAFAAAYTGYYAAAYAAAYQTAYATAYVTAISSGPTAGNATASAAVAAAAADDAATAAATLSAIQAATTACDSPATAAEIAAQATAAADERVAGLLVQPDTGTLAWSSAGARLTTSLGPVDLGLQAFYGFLPTPAVSADPAAIAAADNRVELVYNRYLQAGLDLATVLLGFNIRAEAAANLTDDLDGEDPGIFNPHIAWSFGFDRDLFLGINVNLQGNGSYRLFDEGVGTEAFDIEDGTDPTRTRITGLLSRKFFKDRLETKVAGVYGVEDADWLVSPALVLAMGDAMLELGAGIFGGPAEGELGQFADSSFARLSLSYEF